MCEPPDLTPKNGAPVRSPECLNHPLHQPSGVTLCNGTRASSLSLPHASGGHAPVEPFLPGVGPPPAFPPGFIWEVGSPSPGAELRVGAEGRLTGCGSLAFWTPGLASAPLSPVLPGLPAAGRTEPGRQWVGRRGPVASPSHSRLWPPLQGGAWLKVMSGSLSAPGPSTDLQCHLPHRLGEASRGLALGSCLDSLMNLSVNTVGAWPVWRPFLTPDSLRERVK